jgi:hypothetical protein
MRGREVWLGLAIIMVVIGMVLVGCATGPSSSPNPSQADLLKSAGFRTHTAKTSQGMAYIHTLPAKKVVLNQYQDKPLYLVCTDPDSKQCYLGDEAAYRRYQQLAIQQSYSEDLRNVEEHRWDPEALQMWVNSQGGG